MAIPIGPGVNTLIEELQATPIDPAGEVYQPANFDASITRVILGAADGTHKAVRLIYYDKARNVTIAFRPEVGGNGMGPDDGDFFLPVPTPPSPSGDEPEIVGPSKGFDIAYPQGQNLPAVITTLGATFIGVYIGGQDYIGNWSAQQARDLQPLLDAQANLQQAGTVGGIVPIYVPKQGAVSAGDTQQAEGDAQDALVIADDVWGFTLKGNIMVDIEAGTWFANPNRCIDYMNAFQAAMAAIQPDQDPDIWDPGVYGPRPCCDTFRNNPACGTWLASWDGDPDVEGYDMHQYRGSTTIDGVGVDLNVALLRQPAFRFARF